MESGRKETPSPHGEAAAPAYGSENQGVARATDRARANAPRHQRPAFIRWLKHVLGVGDREPVDEGLARINERLGLGGTPEDSTPRKAADVRVTRTIDRPRSIFFAPNMDGQADSGEVVWVPVPAGNGDEVHERAILVIGRTRTTVFGLLISPNPEHADEDWWLSIGSGDWDETGRPCWVRLDRLLEVSEQDVRREGILFPQSRFERIANRLRAKYHWA